MPSLARSPVNEQTSVSSVSQARSSSPSRMQQAKSPSWLIASLTSSSHSSSPSFSLPSILAHSPTSFLTFNKSVCLTYLRLPLRLLVVYIYYSCFLFSLCSYLSLVFLLFLSHQGMGRSLLLLLYIRTYSSQTKGGRGFIRMGCVFIYSRKIGGGSRLSTPLSSRVVK